MAQQLEPATMRNTMPRRRNSGKSDKRTFVLSQAADMPAKAVVEKARSEGIHLKEHYVYVVRSNARMEKKRGGISFGLNRSAKENEFRRLTLELGLGKSKELLLETERRVADLIDGK